MKKLVIPLLVGIVALGTLTLAVPKQAGAAYNDFGPGTNIQPLPGATQTVAEQEHAALRQWRADGKPLYYLPAGGTSHAYVSCDQSILFWCVAFTTHFSHQDVSSASFLLAVGYVANMVNLVCAAMPNPVATLGCFAAMLTAEAVIGYLMIVAAHKTTNVIAWWCAPGQWLCSAAGIAGAFWNPFLAVWEFPMQISGLDIEWSFVGVPIGYNYNLYNQ